jgi:hypothetical protein
MAALSSNATRFQRKTLQFARFSQRNRHDVYIAMHREQIKNIAELAMSQLPDRGQTL